MTLHEACDAIAQDVKRFKNPLFKKDGKGGLVSVSDVPFGASEKLGWTAFLEYGGKICSEVPADLLGKPVGQDGFTIHIVDLNDPENIREQKLFSTLAEIYRKAAEKDDASAKALFDLEICCYSGHIVEKNLMRAVSLFQKAADQGHAGAQYKLGVCYCNGEGVEKDQKQAAELFRKAADQGTRGSPI